MKNKRYEELINCKSKYCYSGTNVLINKLGILDEKLLEDVDRSFSTYKLSEIYLNNFPGNFDIKHYLSIHRYLFEDLYDFAGEIRNENISKNGVTFCRPEFIWKYLKYTLLQMKTDVPKIANEEILLNYLAHYYGELDIIHPFREGNGRVQREFFRQYMGYINQKLVITDYRLEYSNWSKRDKEKLIEACLINAHTKNTDLLKEVLSKSLVKDKSKIMIKKNN